MGNHLLKPISNWYKTENHNFSYNNIQERITILNVIRKFIENNSEYYISCISKRVITVSYKI